MKGKKKVINITIGVLILICFIFIFKLYHTNSIEFSGVGNSMDNINEKGIATENEKYIVYLTDSNYSGITYINKETGEKKKIDTVGNGSNDFFNLVDNTIYYNKRGKLYKYDINTSKNKIVFNENTENTIIYNNNIYTIKYNDNLGNNTGYSKLYKTDLNGKSKKVILEKCERFYLYKDKIYYTNYDDNFNLYSCDLSGENINKIADFSCAQISVRNDTVFAISLNNQMLYTMGLNGENCHKLSELKIQSINVTDDKILFSSNGELCVTNFDFKNIKPLSNGVFVDINVVGNKVFFRRPVDDKYAKKGIYVLNLDKNIETDVLNMTL